MTKPRQVIVDTFSGDIHALAIQWAIEKRGVTCELFFGDDFPSTECISVWPTARGAEIEFKSDSRMIRVDGSSQTTYWARRCAGPLIDTGVHPADGRVALREAQSMLESTRTLLGAHPNVTSVNPSAGRAKYKSKPMQLCIAAEAGLRTPHSLFSNNRDEIVGFLGHTANGLYKSFMPAYWKVDENRAHSCLAALVDPSSFPESAVVQMSPGIYQGYVEKDFEVRVVVMGDSYFATRLESQVQPQSRVDWRGCVAGVQQSMFDVPPDMQLLCKQFMQKSGLLFGCLDFIVTNSGEWIFLECNEQGQWLWQESVCEDLPLLDAFSDFLLEPTSSFRYKPTSTSLNFSEFCKSELYVRRNEVWAGHKAPAEPFRSEEPAPVTHPPVFNG